MRNNFSKLGVQIVVEGLVSLQFLFVLGVSFIMMEELWQNFKLSEEEKDVTMVEKCEVAGFKQ